jgi:signal transduction histidine kinase
VQATGESPSASPPEYGTRATRAEHRLFSRVVRWISWLREWRRFVIVLTIATIAAGFALDLAVPGYAIAGFYLVPILLAAFALPGRYAAGVGILSLALTTLVMILQDRVNAQNILLVWFGVLAAVGLFALAYLYNRFDQLYESERRTTSRLHVLTAQLGALQEEAILEPASRPDALLARIASQAQQLLGSDACGVYRLDGEADSLTLAAEAGAKLPGEGCDDAHGPRAVARQALARRAAVLDGSRLAVPLAVRDDVFGAIVLSDRDRRALYDEDIGIAKTFGDQAALALENARLRESVERAAAAAERTRIARELHDSVTQSLFAASLAADVVAETCPGETPQARQALEDLRRLTRGALAEMRTMLLEMRPDSLVRAPLPELLRHLAESAQSRARIAVELGISCRRALPDDVHVAFYRVAQEALNNVVRHAAASSVRVTVCGADAVELTVSDDGHGFDPSAVAPERLGILTMRERAAGIGARLTVDSDPDRGTVVSLAWPGDGRKRPADG